ncbi:AMP-binding protein [Anaerocolumna sedimenticola]|uniref:AMP-binding protein n=2 Tax=Anaerocolumna sedimenticola TaxID=2696063 RepID=A0A6P1TQ03_9FIRM|nr:AMP-binding protein [Anaerocolumna sedimenticola]QHQ62289.1 AMP-binding protein [Anaerocolumna sedimenticola]
MVCINTSSTKSELSYVLNQSESTFLFITKGFKGNPFMEHLQSLCPELKSAEPGCLSSKELPKLKTVVSLDNTQFPGTFSLGAMLKLGKKINTEELAQIQNQVTSKDPLNIFYTSGTTGKAKGAVLNHFSTVNNAITSGERMEYDPEDRILLCLPLFHVIGFVLSTISGLLYGSAIVIAERFETKKVPELIMEESCTVFNGVPTMFNFLLNNDLSIFDLSSLRKGFIAGSCCSEDLLMKIIEELGIENIANLYGQTEAIGITQMAAEDVLYHRLHSIGKPLPGVEIKVLDFSTGEEVICGEKGELCVKSVYIMDEYYKNMEATNRAIDKDGWLHTGDIVSCDSEGYITIKGRIKELIIRGGENVSTVEIENVLKRHRGIMDAAVIGVPDELLGEEIFAFIIKKPNAEALEKEVILDFAHKNMAKYKVPKYIVFVNSFPVSSSGKVRKSILREQAKKELEKVLI